MWLISLLIVVTVLGCASAGHRPVISPAQTSEAAGMVDVRTLVPDIQVDMRYAGSRNFVGTPITGYEAARCFVLRPVAQALRRVEAALRKQHLKLRVFDCYRPVRAVQHFVRWAKDPDDQRTKAEHYPNLGKEDLLGEYIASSSGHSRGATLDLTLVQCDVAGENCEPLDMGTDFDFFDVLAHTDAPGVTPLQRDNRHRLRDAMQREGFRNYPQEWWHYTLTPEPSPDVAYDFPVTSAE